MTSLILDQLQKTFNQSVVVQDFTLSVQSGELVALLGPSGCGKTTTLRMIAGFEQVSGGEIRTDRRVLSRAGMTVPPEQRHMSMIFQTYAVWPHLTVFENVAFGLRLARHTGQDITKRVHAMLATVRLDHLADRYPSQLSGGQQQRVSLARALAVQPEILLLDEPLSNLDAGLREEMRFEIRRLHDEFGITSIYVTHDQAEAMVAADRIVVMNAGHIEQIGTAEEIYDRPASRFVAEFIGTSNILNCTYSDGRIMLGPHWLMTSVLDDYQPESSSVIIAIRPHVVGLSHASEVGMGEPNVFPGTVRRSAFLGDSIDYLVKLEHADTPVRVTTNPILRFAVGDKVCVRFPPEYCRRLKR